jgi:hypothetical protein
MKKFVVVLSVAVGFLTVGIGETIAQNVLDGVYVK